MGKRKKPSPSLGLERLEGRTAALEAGTEIQGRQLGDICHDLKILISNITTINGWISSQFGVNLLISKESRAYKCVAVAAQGEDIDIENELNQSPSAEAAAAIIVVQGIKEENLTCDVDDDKSEEEFILPISCISNAEQEQEDEDLPTSSPSPSQVHSGFLIDGGMDFVLKVETPDPEQDSAASQTQDTAAQLQAQICGALLSPSQSIVADSTPSPSRSGSIVLAEGNQPDSNSEKTTHEEEAQKKSTRKPFNCPHCQRTFKNGRQLAADARTHTQEKTHACTACPRRFFTARRKQIHERTHTGERPFSCPTCHRKFGLSGTLKRHMLIHAGEKPFACTICPRSFHHQKALEEHLNRHRDVRPYQCSKCPARFCSQRGLYGHELNVHKMKRRHVCDVCKEIFNTVDGLKSHLKGHIINEDEAQEEGQTAAGGPSSASKPAPDSTEKPAKAAPKPRVICQYCDRTFAQRASMLTHMRIHTGEKPFRCSVCQQGFTKSNGLKAHMRMHTGERPHGCTLCPLSFAQRASLEGHMNRYHRGGEKPYACEVCKMAFYSKLSHHKHVIRTNHVMKKWTCKVCGICFQSNHGLKVHLGQHYRKGEMVEVEEVKLRQQQQQRQGQKRSNNSVGTGEEVKILPD